MNIIQTKKGANFTAIDLGPFEQLHHYTFKHPALSREVDGKIFLNQLMGLTSCEISLNTLPPKTSIPFYHKHGLNEETYIFTKGEGEFQIDEKVLSIREGTVIRVSQEGERCWRNTSATQDLHYIEVQARAETFQGQAVEDGLGIPKRVRWVGKRPV